MTPMGRPAPSIRRNTAINLAGAAVPIAVSLVTIPLYLDAVGQTRYGVLAVVWLLLGFWGVFDLGLGRATANRVARLRDAPSEQRQTLAWTALALSGALGVVGGLCLLAVGGAFLGDVLDLPQDLRAEAVAGLPFVAAAVPLVVVGSVFSGALTGLERFGLVNVLEVSTIAAYQVAPLAVARLYGPDLTWMLAAAAAAPLAGATLGALACARVLPLSGRARFDRAAAASLARYGGWVTVTRVLVPLLTVADRLVVGAVSGARAVTQYTIPVSLVARLDLVPMSVTRTLFPRFSGLSAAEATEMARKALLTLGVVMTPLVVTGVVLLDPFLRLWVGDSLADVAAPIGEIALIGVWINSLAFVPHTFLEGRGRPDLPAKLHLLELAPYLGAVWLGLSAAGLEGAAWAWTARAAVNAVALLVAARIYRPRSELAPPGLLVAVACVGALTLFSDPVWRASVGGALVALSLGAAWRAAPEAVRALVPRRS